MTYKNYIKPIELHELIASVVDSMRETGAISTVIGEGSNYRYIASNSLNKNDYISISDDATEYNNIRILDADVDSFVISAEYPTANTYKAKAPYFEHDKENKAAEVLTEKTAKGNDVAWQKYPLILLKHPYTSKHNNNVNYTVPFTLFIIHNTDNNYRTDERYLNVLDNIIFPIYEDLLTAMGSNINIKEYDPYLISHKKTDLLNINGNPFPDHMDGIKLDFEPININTPRKCQPLPIQLKYSLTTEIYGNGIISPTNGLYNAGDIVMMITAPNSGYELVETIVNEGEQDEFTTTDAWFDLNMDGNKTARAYFQAIVDQYYQSVIKGIQGEIVWDETEQLWKYENQGTGGEPVPLYIKNTPVATFDGIITIGFSDLTGRSIVDSEGTSTPTINGNNVEITAGYLTYFELDNGEQFYLQNTKGGKIYGTLGSIGTLSSTIGVWGTPRNDVTPYGLMLGGSLFQNDTDDEYLRIVGVDVATEPGYNKIDYYASNCGIWDTSNTFLEPDDTGLNAAFAAYSELNGLANPNNITHTYLKNMLAYPQAEIIGGDNTVSKLKLPSQEMFNSAPTQIGQTHAYKNELSTQSINPNVKIHFYGNSLTKSSVCSPTVKYPRGVANLLNDEGDLSYDYVNLGINGYKGSEMATNFATDVLPHLDQNRRNILVFFEFYNDMVYGGATAQEANDHMVSVNSQAKAAGIETMVMTCSRTTSSADNAKIDAANAILDSNHDMFDYYYDQNTIDEMQNPVIPTTTCDGVHHNTVGTQAKYEGVAAYMVANVIESIPNDIVKIHNNIAFQSNGLDERLSRADNEDTHLGAADFTIFTKLKIRDVSNTPRLFSKRAGVDWIEIYINNNGLSIRVDSRSSTQAISGEPLTDIKVDDTLDYALVRVGEVGKLYLNGSEIGSVPMLGDYVSTAQTLIGGYSTLWTDAEWYEHKQYNRALSAVEVSALHNQMNIDNTDLVVDLDFNFIDDALMIDKSDQLNDFTIVSNDIANTRITNNLRPWHLTDGCTIFVSELSGADYRTATYKANGNPSVSAIVGFIKVGDFPRNSGVLVGLRNTYLGIKYLDWETNEKTYEDIKALESVIAPSGVFQIDNAGKCIKGLKVL